ncbi:MAG TPA: Mur ligase family protein [Candidatus Saccharimonadales bacterium]|nr:Mur ligase family protein [Candidatus Saccharimonadales bacterium]
MLKGILSFYSPSYPKALVYMMQRCEYQAVPYLKWYWRTSNFRKIAVRGKLDKTMRARSLLLLLNIGILVELIVGFYFVYLGTFDHIVGYTEIGVSILIAYPLIWAYVLVIPVALSRWLVVLPMQRQLISKSKAIFKNHPAVKIAVAGSYGKTTMKELLAVVLAEAKKVAATPANKNVSVSHAEFAAKLSGDEQVLIIEYGEERPGDIKSFCEKTYPNVGVITGLAPAHLNHYPTLEAAGTDIFYLTEYLKHKDSYVNGESSSLKPFITAGDFVYSESGVGEWKAQNIKVDFEGISFKLKKGKQELDLKSNLLGRHQIGPLSSVAVIALGLGLTKYQVEAGISKTSAFEHRMEPRELAGAFVIDDTYNGNIEGIRAGLELLEELSARRKIYVTPGLVDQGVETKSVHHEVGRLIAKANPDVVVLMRNSVTSLISAGLKEVGFKGELRIEDDPLSFYTNLEQFVASGDLVLMQNDWPDNYY